MSYLRPGRTGENRRSVFYTNNSSEEWEMVDAPPKDFPEQKPHPETHRRKSTPCGLTRPPSGQSTMILLLMIKHKFSPLPDSFGSAFTFDFVRNSSRPKRPLLRDMMGSGRFGRSADARSSDGSLVECNGSKPLDLQVRLQSQQEELSQLQLEQVKLREELASHKVH